MTAAAEQNEAQPKWTSQRPFIATAWHIDRKWGLAQESIKCGICRRVFQIGDRVRWVCATAHGCYNFFVCEFDDTSDVIERWQEITRLAQKDEYDLAAEIVKLRGDLMRCVAVEEHQP